MPIVYSQTIEADRERARAFAASRGWGTTEEKQLAMAFAAHRFDEQNRLINQCRKES